MSYEPTTWKAGDVVTAAKLNKLEEGVAQGGGGNTPLFVHATEDAETHIITCDKTWQEINDAFMSGRPVIMDVPGDAMVVWSPIGVKTNEEMGIYGLIFIAAQVEFATETADGYPYFPYQYQNGN